MIKLTQTNNRMVWVALERITLIEEGRVHNNDVNNPTHIEVDGLDWPLMVKESAAQVLAFISERARHPA